MKHYQITIKVSYDETTVPEGVDMIGELEGNIHNAVDRGELFNDRRGEAVIEEWSCAVEEVIDGE